MHSAQRPFVEFMGVRISNVNYSEARRMLGNCLAAGKKGYVCVTDVGNVIAATKDPHLKKAINESLLSVQDGTPLGWYAKLVGCTSMERISGMDLLDRLFRDPEPFSHFLLGDTEETIARVKAKALQFNSRLQISGHSPPFRDFTEEDNKDIINRINAERPDFIWVCFGGSKQEKWMMDFHNELEKGIMVGVGAGFRWFIGEITSPPRIMQKIGLQFLYRWISEISKDPVKALISIYRRPLKRFPIFIANFPFQVIAERKRLRGRDLCLQERE